MKEFTFSAWCKSGKFCSGGTAVEVSLTEEEAERLVKFGTDPEIFYSYKGFYNCRDIHDIYDKVYEIAVIQITDEQKEWMDEDDEEEAEILNTPNWRADDLYEVVVEFTRDFEKKLGILRAAYRARILLKCLYVCMVGMYLSHAG